MSEQNPGQSAAESATADVLGQIKARMESQAIERARKDALGAKKLVMDEKKTDLAYERMKISEAEMEKAKSTSYTVATQEYLDAILLDNDEYMEAAKHAINFICKTFDGAVPFFRKNLIGIAGKTGEGKSTSVANIVFGVLGHRHPVTKQLLRMLIVTNEEKAADFYNRITCLIHGWHYVNHNEFTDHQKETFRKFIPILMRQIMVIDDSYNKIPGTTTTIEGLTRVFDNLMVDPLKYDLILVDYYQNCRTSKLEPRLQPHEVQSRLATYLDVLKNEYPAPIVVMFQVRPPDDKETPLEYRMKGSKDLLTKCTHIMEMIAEREDMCTAWSMEKSRFTKALGKIFRTGFDSGKYVVYDDAFKLKVAKKKEEQMWAETQGKNVFKKEPKDGDKKEDLGGVKGEEVKEETKV